MRQSFRRILACVLAFVMVAGLGISAFAEGEAAANAELYRAIAGPDAEGAGTLKTASPEFE